jgi:selenide,water dikinase
MSPGDLAQVLRHLPPGVKDENLLVGYGTSDDAGVYRLSDDVALVQTVDFFTPIVDDPYDFGRIAAANALSDVYAMGGKPLTVMNLAGFPVDDIDLSVLADILRGGSVKILEAGAVLVGGHTIDDLEPKYGLSVTGVVHPDHIMQNSSCRAGDDLVLTKPIGTGIITTAVKRGLATPELVSRVTEIMATLNKAGAEAMLEVGAHACTDITGFGLTGHALEMAKGSGVDIVLESRAVPCIPEAISFARDGVVPGGTESNLEYVKEWVEFDASVPENMQFVLCDAMTSGGLLIALSPEKTPALMKALSIRGVQGHLVGRAQRGDGRIRVV